MTVGSRRRSTGPDKLTVDALRDRSEGCCELCGHPLHGERGRDYHVHHRRPRRMGGSQLPDTNSIENLLLLDASCHERVESERTAGYAGGWLVRQDGIPATVAVLIHGKRWCLLTDDGEYRPVETVEVPDAD